MARPPSGTGDKQQNRHSFHLPGICAKSGEHTQKLCWNKESQALVEGVDTEPLGRCGGRDFHRIGKRLQLPSGPLP